MGCSACEAIGRQCDACASYQAGMERGRQDMKLEILEWLRDLQNDSSNPLVLADRIEKEFR